MKTRVLLVSCLLLAACTSTPGVKSRVVSMRNGNVYLGSTGPFSKVSADRYTCPDTGGLIPSAVHVVSRRQGGGWVYTYSHAAMYAVPVDGRVLD